MMSTNSTLLEKKVIWVWLDLEMTGLFVDTDVILEIALVLTDHTLKQLEKPFSCAIFQPKEILKNMNDWCKQHHTKSGLLDLVANSTVLVADAEQTICKMLNQYPSNTIFILCGNSIFQDRLFVNKYMPNFASKLHYRMIDVSSIKELIKGWYPDTPKSVFTKQKNHRAVDDISESIKELTHYKNYFFID